MNISAAVSVSTHGGSAYLPVYIMGHCTIYRNMHIRVYRDATLTLAKFGNEWLVRPLQVLGLFSRALPWELLLCVYR